MKLRGALLLFLISALTIFLTFQTENNPQNRYHTSKYIRAGLPHDFATNTAEGKELKGKMENASISLLFLSLFFLVKSQAQLAPALYKFGDSIVDSGSNQFLDTLANAEYVPYGFDFPINVTGRFTNGLTITDNLGN